MATAIFLVLLIMNVAEGFWTRDMPMQSSARPMCRRRHRPSVPFPHFSWISHNDRKGITWQLGLSADEDSNSYESERYVNTGEIFMGGEASDSPQPSTANNNAISRTPSFTPIELPIDGSIVVLLPAAVIAIFGIITSAMVFASSGDPILAPQGAEVPLIENINNSFDQSNQCRGLGCGRSQESDLDSLRNFMGKFAKDQAQRDGDVPALATPNSDSSVEI